MPKVDTGKCEVVYGALGYSFGGSSSRQASITTSLESWREEAAASLP